MDLTSGSFVPVAVEKGVVSFGRDLPLVHMKIDPVPDEPYFRSIHPV
jgi:hypothetical protein